MIALQVIIALVNIAGNVLCMCLIKFVGKRRLYLFTLVGCAMSCFSIGKYLLRENERNLLNYSSAFSCVCIC